MLILLLNEIFLQNKDLHLFEKSYHQIQNDVEICKCDWYFTKKWKRQSYFTSNFYSLKCEGNLYLTPHLLPILVSEKSHSLYLCVLKDYIFCLRNGYGQCLRYNFVLNISWLTLNSLPFLRYQFAALDCRQVYILYIYNIYIFNY